MTAFLRSYWLLFFGIVALLTAATVWIGIGQESKPVVLRTSAYDSSWHAPSLYTDRELEGAQRRLVIYGQDLIARTALYFGPRGSIATISNGMNCQNCHLQAGKKTWGNNYGAVASTYPRFRERSGTTESIYKRVSDCFERSLNGVAPDSNSIEYQAIEAYIKWVGKETPSGVTPKGTGIYKLPYIDRAADPTNGKVAYQQKCQSCHGNDGQGQLASNGILFEYPPLWGKYSYNTGAGLYRLSRFAGYIYSNMPWNQTHHDNPTLSIEECWDIAAFVNSQPRPTRDLSKDWPDISKKPIDHPFGPFHDGFSEQQHKYGPYEPILATREKLKK